jgi:hypothetical protein
MIKSIQSLSPHVTVDQYTPPYIGGNSQSAGQMRFNTNTQQVDVYDGNSWISMSQNVNVRMSYTAEEAIRWAERKMRDEHALEERMAQHPGLKDAYEKFQLMDILSRELDVKSA